MIARAIAFAIPLAIALALLPEMAVAAENRPVAPVIVSPTAQQIKAVSGDLVVSGTGTPGDIVYVGRFASQADYASAVARDEKAYQQFESGTPLGGFGGQGATVSADGSWSMTESGTDLARSAKDGAVYVAASQATFNRTSSSEYPTSRYSSAVRVVLAWLGRPAVPTITSPARGAVQARQADGSVLVTGTGVSGAIVIGFLENSLAEYNVDIQRFEQQKGILGTACPSGNAFCAAVTVSSNGKWAFALTSVDLQRAVRGTLIVAAAQSVNNSTSDRWSAVSAPREFTIGDITVSTGPRTTNIVSPSVFSQLEAFNWRTFTPSHVALTAGAALVLSLLVGLPTALLEKSLEKTHEARERRFAKFRKRVGIALTRPRAALSKVKRKVPPALLIAIWFVIAAIIASFADPAFGFNLMSVRMVLTLIASFAVLNLLGAYVTWWLTARSSGTKRPKFPLLPTNLLILVATVVLARLIHLQPALVLGSVLGLDFGIRLAANRKGRVVLVGAAYAAALGILAWIAYGLSPASPGNFWALLLAEFFAQLAIAGISTLPVTLLPFRSLNGEALFLWRKLIWGVSYAVGLVFFFLILLPMPFSWKAVSQPLEAWIGLFVLYALVAIFVWLAIRFTWFSRKKSAISATG